MKLLNELPDDIILNIYVNVDIKDLINLCQCNKYFIIILMKWYIGFGKK